MNGPSKFTSAYLVNKPAMASPDRDNMPFRFPPFLGLYHLEAFFLPKKRSNAACICTPITDGTLLLAKTGSKRFTVW
ncbi:MAG: hypothetical protein GY712_04335 [Oceanicoccus sp.]|uniref:hypothetical protein n=1 Tax=Oceanicoccus sp. TaxID=2691044 RepID=UPI0026232604|nr:hypothetical protein [Oceanicoccus sp.]MCP3907224.1 hypothetical protein [Oceanicoccus sp.]